MSETHSQTPPDDSINPTAPPDREPREEDRVPGQTDPLEGRPSLFLPSLVATQQWPDLVYQTHPNAPLPIAVNPQPNPSPTMNSDIKDTIKTLNNLIEVLKDGQQGFDSAAKHVKVPELARYFERYSEQRAEFAAELQARVLALGADAETSGTLGGSMHRGWTNLKTALSSNDPRILLEEAERGEDTAVAAYREAIECEGLDRPTKDIVSSQYGDIKAAHDHVKMLRDSHTYRKAS